MALQAFFGNMPAISAVFFEVRYVKCEKSAKDGLGVQLWTLKTEILTSVFFQSGQKPE
jgi:hypothetical protein